MDEHDGRDPGTVRPADPWFDDIASGDGSLPAAGAAPLPVITDRDRDRDRERAPGPAGHPAPHPAPQGSVPAGPRSAEAVYLEVYGSAAFQEVRRRYRRFVFPASLAFLAWYGAYVIASTAAPDLMARPVTGSLNIAMLAGLGQFASTFLLTWAYVRHARLRRDRAALELRWVVYEQNRHHQNDGKRGHVR